MPSGAPDSPNIVGDPHRFLPLLLLLFVGSGLSALIYEVVWFQLLELVVGSSAISLGVLLATFMGGMCIGSLGFARIASRTQHPLRTYAILEAGIALIGILELFAIPLVGKLYSPAVGHGYAALILRAVVAGICLLPPTILMGATLPAVARWVESTPRGVSWLGFFYGGNIAGAVCGSVLAGFYLLKVHDGSYATYVAAFVNLVVAALAMALATRTPGLVRDIAQPVVSRVTGVISERAVLIAIAISGACALGSEVVWTRLLSLTFGASTYTFSMILAVFLSGLGVGSATGAWLSRIVASPRAAFAWCQFLLMFAIMWAAVVIFLALPNWPINPSLAPSEWFTLQLDLTRCALAVFPAACLWGASFPFALAALSTPGQDTGALVGRVYAANTVGSILGALVCSLLLIPFLGTRDAQRALIAGAGVAATLLLLSNKRLTTSKSGETQGASTAQSLGIVLAPALALLLVLATPQLPGMLVAYGRYAVTWLGKADVLYVGEGMNSSVAVTKVLSSGATQFHVSGKVEASSLPQDMRLQRMLAHLPALVHPDPQSVLVVGFGAGVTAGSFIPYPNLKRLVICEIEPLVPRVVSTWFAKENNDVVHDPRTQVYFDDARSFVLTTDEQFDVITSDPINPWVKGAASLYTLEYFQSVKRHLKPGGVVTQWVPLYESTLEAVQSELATFFKVFPEGTVWANNLDGRGYDVVLLAQEGAARIDIQGLEARFAQAGYQRVAASLSEVGFNSPIELFGTYAGSGKDLGPWLANAAINTDRNLRLQYLAGVGINTYQEASIFEQIARQRRFPETLFVASDAWKAQLRDAIGGR